VTSILLYIVAHTQEKNEKLCGNPMRSSKSTFILMIQGVINMYLNTIIVACVCERG
jgi:hypothetical protein